MGISDKLAELNRDRFLAFSTPFDLDNARAAAYFFAGDTYMGLDAESMTDNDMEFAQGHLGILSGLYGLLRPLDLIQPYRLEMGTRLQNPKGDDLYQFWGTKIAQAINLKLNESEEKVLINLASKEYFRSVDTKKIKAKIITPVFKEERNGKLKIISFNAKRARGMMARYIIDNRLLNPESIKSFCQDGYRFNAELSDDTNWVFTR